VGESLEIHWRTVSKWIVRERRAGPEALASRESSGRPPGLTDLEREKLLRLIVGRTPLQLAFGTALGSVPVPLDVVQKRFGTVLHASTVSHSLPHDVRGRIVLVLDRHPAHVAAAARRWLAEYEDRIAVRLMACVPEMSPGERL
jgi:hypothetical protein